MNEAAPGLCPQKQDCVSLASISEGTLVEMTIITHYEYKRNIKIIAGENNRAVWSTSNGRGNCCLVLVHYKQCRFSSQSRRNVVVRAES